jgi:hypothetical protein
MLQIIIEAVAYVFARGKDLEEGTEVERRPGGGSLGGVRSLSKRGGFVFLNPALLGALRKQGLSI